MRHIMRRVTEGIDSYAVLMLGRHSVVISLVASPAVISVSRLKMPIVQSTQEILWIVSRGVCIIFRVSCIRCKFRNGEVYVTGQC